MQRTVHYFILVKLFLSFKGFYLLRIFVKEFYFYIKAQKLFLNVKNLDKLLVVPF